jgi:hypothetical protein
MYKTQILKVLHIFNGSTVARQEGISVLQCTSKKALKKKIQQEATKFFGGKDTGKNTFQYSNGMLNVSLKCTKKKDDFGNTIHIVATMVVFPTTEETSFFQTVPVEGEIPEYTIIE